MIPATSTDRHEQLQLTALGFSPQRRDPESPAGPPTPSSPPNQQNSLPPSSPAPSVADLPRDELLDLIFKSKCKHHRWERELLFGATDDELAHSIGNTYCYGSVGTDIDLHFQNDQEPALTVTYRIFNVTLTTASFGECASYIRRIKQIPQKKPDHECAALLAQKLDEIRVERRSEIKSRVRSIAGEKYQRTSRRSKKTSNESHQLSVTDEIVELLFAPDCMSESSDKRLLIRITKLLHRKAGQDFVKAAENAVQIIKNARSDWTCYTGYWTNDYSLSSSSQKPAAS
jgi:hypothetical protein